MDFLAYWWFLEMFLLAFQLLWYNCHSQNLQCASERWFFIFTFIVISLTGSVLVSDKGSKMYPTGSKSEDRKSFLDPEENELVEVDLDDPWVRREDYKPKKCTHVQGTRGEKLKLKQERNKNISQKLFSVVTKRCVTIREEKNPKDFRRRLSVRSLFLCKKPCHSDWVARLRRHFSRKIVWFSSRNHVRCCKNPVAKLPNLSWKLQAQSPLRES